MTDSFSRPISQGDHVRAALPTADVDAYIIAHMGYTAATLAALGKATRRDRRREARQRMVTSRKVLV